MKHLRIRVPNKSSAEPPFTRTRVSPSLLAYSETKLKLFLCSFPTASQTMLTALLSHRFQTRGGHSPSRAAGFIIERIPKNPPIVVDSIPGQGLSSGEKRRPFVPAHRASSCQQCFRLVILILPIGRLLLRAILVCGSLSVGQ